jgi:hypothetical protein
MAIVVGPLLQVGQPATAIVWKEPKDEASLDLGCSKRGRRGWSNKWWEYKLFFLKIGLKLKLQFIPQKQIWYGRSETGSRESGGWPGNRGGSRRVGPESLTGHHSFCKSHVHMHFWLFLIFYIYIILLKLPTIWIFCLFNKLWGGGGRSSANPLQRITLITKFAL